MTSLKDKIAAWPENAFEIFAKEYGHKLALKRAASHSIDLTALTILQRECIEELVNAYKLLLTCYAEMLDDSFTEERDNLKQASNRMDCAMDTAQELLTKTKA